MHQEFRSDIRWYLQLNWGKWYCESLMGFTKSLRKTDVLMSAMFKVSRGQKIRSASLIEVIGFPDLIEGDIDNGGFLYGLHKAMHAEVNQHWMMMYSRNGILVDPVGTNLRLYFRMHSAFKWYKVWNKLRFG